MSSKSCPTCAVCGGVDPERRAWDYGGKNYCGTCYLALEEQGAVLDAECKSCSAVMWVGTVTCPLINKETKEEKTVCMHCWWDDYTIYTAEGFEIKENKDEEDEEEDCLEKNGHCDKCNILLSDDDYAAFEMDNIRKCEMCKSEDEDEEDEEDDEDDEDEEDEEDEEWEKVAVKTVGKLTTWVEIRRDTPPEIRAQILKRLEEEA